MTETNREHFFGDKLIADTICYLLMITIQGKNAGFLNKN